MYKFIIVLLFMFVRVDMYPNDRDECKILNCYGEEYECIDGRCHCALGYTPNSLQNGCVKCPGLGESCIRTCCSTGGNSSIYCWRGTCRYCFDEYENWICNGPIDQVLLVSVSQIAMATALVLGILATFVLLYKLCTSTDARNFGMPSRTNSRVSIGSLQLYVNERLRDAPPRYSRQAPLAESTIYPTVYIVNAGFVHDSSTTPPPVYSPSPKSTDSSSEQPPIHI